MFQQFILLPFLSCLYARITSVHDRNEINVNLESFETKSKYSYCSNPVQKAKVNFPDRVIGRANVTYDMYSGYVNITSAPDYLFYWFFSTKDGNPNAPLIIWTNGEKK
jgi:carboxypeptidase C (cathepsin A)